MTLFIIALHAEAAPLIDLYHLRRETEKPFHTYRNHALTVVISGIGTLNAAAATAYALGAFSVDIVVNYGTCAAADRSVQTGTLWQIGKLIDSCSGSVYHLAKEKAVSSFATLHTLPRPLLKRSDAKIELADMEAAGVYAAARRFVPKEQIMVLKIVSDHMEEKILSKEAHAALQQKHLPLLQKVVEG